MGGKKAGGVSCSILAVSQKDGIAMCLNGDYITVGGAAAAVTLGTVISPFVQHHCNFKWSQMNDCKLRTAGKLILSFMKRMSFVSAVLVWL